MADLPLRVWHFPLPEHIPPDFSLALLILNTPFSLDSSHSSSFISLWKRSSLRVCADGGANRLFDFAACLPDRSSPTTLVPDFIKGDLDSIRPDVLEFYEATGTCQIIQDPDQDSTDLGKCLDLMCHQFSSDPSFSASNQILLILGGLSGRLDQTVHTLHTLLVWNPTLSGHISEVDQAEGRTEHLVEAWVVDPYAGSMACALQAQARNLLPIPNSIRSSKSPLTCGILPIGVDEAIITTRGLKWNLNSAKSSVRGLLSTSNHVLPSSKLVEIEVDKPVIWTIQLSHEDAIGGEEIGKG